LEREKLHLGIRQTLSKKSSVPSFRDMGAGDATKTGRSVLKFSEESARSGPGARKSPQNGKSENQQGGYTSLKAPFIPSLRLMPPTPKALGFEILRFEV
jgi:hypothetical protein